MAQRRTTRPERRSSGALAAVWLVASLALVAVPAWVGLTRPDPMLNGHPVTLVIGFALLVTGVVGAICAVVVLVDRLRRRRGGDNPPRRRWRTAVSVPVLVLLLATTGFLGWSRPFAADPVALQALDTTTTVRVVQRLTSYTLFPTRETRTGAAIPPTTGLVFYPGARVDARAYAALLRPLAEAGYVVVVVKEPFGIGLLDPGAARRIPALYPEVTRWVVGGHSLGGIPAATVADDDRTFTGLVLYASEPAGTLTRTDLRVLSVSGSKDGLETPDRIAAARDRLPADATAVVVQGGVHAFFGDYGNQPGDGVPTVSRERAQQQIAAATQKFLAALPAGTAPGRPGATPSGTAGGTSGPSPSATRTG
ncbi:hypothetical protein FHX74_002273 [Friedmanniella endophytica]|uniref:Alpha/beta hydrolase fold-5 domain-containing protein n=1 Tax=Microlunatus kandeliicorticis TaxID=1759536 RepID=A0A7W3P669_9ACTN|nr:alpha/beta hydrolase [Microlunatus kandeliicorticis]MBA8794654.1 hypothetical protein [Microlunatus kandeliicorticis]